MVTKSLASLALARATVVALAWGWVMAGGPAFLLALIPLQAVAFSIEAASRKRASS